MYVHEEEKSMEIYYSNAHDGFSKAVLLLNSSTMLEINVTCQILNKVFFFVGITE